MKTNFIGKFMKVASFAVAIILSSCSNPAPVPIPPGTTGFFIVNEGSFGNGNASLSFYDRKADAVTNNVFSVKNGRPLGDQAQSMTVFGDKGYIVVENSNKIEVINTNDYSSITTITDGISSPRYILIISATKAYVSDWGSNGTTGTVKVLDLNTYKVTKTITTGQGANRMLKNGTLVFVTNSGGYGKDNTVKIIDSATDAVTGSITIGDNPNSIQIDNSGNIWVASSGAIVYNSDFSFNTASSTKGSISKITASNLTEALRLTVGKLTYSTPANLDISPDGKTLYYTYDDAIYSLSTSATALPATPFKAKSYYGLAVDPINGNIIGCNAPSFSAAGSLDIYDASGNLVKTYTTGIAPNGVAFK